MDVPRNTEPLLGIGGDNFMGKIDSDCRGSQGAMVVIEPIAVRISDAQRVSGLSRSELYRRAGRGELILLKCGSSTLVDVASLRAVLASLPRAAIRTPTVT
jgi:hypothetical protein